MDIYNITYLELIDYLESINEKKYRAEQIMFWVYEKRVKSFYDMSNLSKDLIEKLDKDFYFGSLELVKEEIDTDVNKYLFKLMDNNRIECVLMRHDYGLSLCISSQVGCNMGCTFCCSGKLKKVRDLSAGEMLLQIIEVEKRINERISHIVIMGIGEPFDNYDNIVKFITNANDYRGLNIGSRHITVSTCGIIPKIKEFSNLPYQVNLAISLHAPNDSLRSKLMPINKVYPLNDLIITLKEYIAKINRRLTFEYILLDDINDHEKEALELCNLIRGMNAYVNLIPYNESDNILYKRSKKDTILKFYDIIKKEGINVTIRKEFGSKISAACGQLRAKKEE